MDRVCRITTILRIVSITASWLAMSEFAMPEEQAELRQVLTRALHALGEPAALARFRAATWTSRGTLQLGETTAPFTSEWAIDGARRYRKAKRSQTGAGEMRTVLVLDQDRAWFQRDHQPVIRFAWEGLTPILIEHYVHWTALRLDIRERALLTRLDPIQVDNRVAVGVKVRDPDAPELDMYFDEANGLPVRIDVHFTDSRGQPATESRILRDDREVDGIKYAAEVEWTGRNGDEPAVQRERRENLNILETIEGALFQQP